MSSSMIAPTVATTIDHKLNPVAPVPPKIPNTKPPTTAPTIPIMAVTIMPPGSSPGSTSLASAPAINPTTIQLMMPIFSLALLSEGLPLLGGRLHHHLPEPVTCLGDAIASPYSPKYLEDRFSEVGLPLEASKKKFTCWDAVLLTRPDPAGRYRRLRYRPRS